MGYISYPTRKLPDESRRMGIFREEKMVDTIRYRIPGLKYWPFSSVGFWWVILKPENTATQKLLTQ